MARLGLKARYPKRFKVITKSNHDKTFQLIALSGNLMSLSRIKFGHWKAGLYVAVVIDLFSRQIVGWAIANHMRTEFV